MRLARLLTLALFVSGCSDDRPLPHSIYVWQQRTDSAVNTAVREAAPQIQTFYLHAANLNFGPNGPVESRFESPWKAVRESNRPTGLVVRIPNALGGLGSNPAQSESFVALSRSLLNAAQEAQVSVSEIQVDYDCPESKLAGYSRFIQQVKARLNGIRIRFTALPAWLGHPEFATLARQADGYVLQVHSLELPRAGDPKVKLCDPVQANKAIAQASRLGVPFSLALPTYRCLVLFNEKGEKIRVISEGTAPNLAEAATVVPALSDADEIAELVRSLQSNRPRELQELIWFRLPVATDRMNWSWPTLQAVMNGRTPRSQLVAEWIADGDSHILQLRNRGERSEPLPAELRAHWQGRFFAADALRSYEFGMDEPRQQIRFRSIDSTGFFNEIPPGETRKIGWVRVADPTSLQLDPPFATK